MELLGIAFVISLILLVFALGKWVFSTLWSTYDICEKIDKTNDLLAENNRMLAKLVELDYLDKGRRSGKLG